MSSLIDPAPTDAACLTRRIRRRRLLLGVALLVLGLGLYVAFCPQPRVALGVLTATATDDGGNVSTGEVSASPQLAAQATAIKSNVSTSSGSSSSKSDGATFPRRTLAVFCESDHLLMQRVGLQLFEGLRQTEQFDQVQYVPRGQSLAVGEEVPDILVTIDMPSLQETGVPVAVKYDAEFAARVGREFARSSYYTQSSSTPSVVQYEADIRTSYDAQQTGVETSGARYTAVSKDVAKSLQKSILDFLEKQDAPALPGHEQIPEFYPAFQPAPDLPVLKALKAVPRMQGPRFMQANCAAWTFASEIAPDELKSQFTTELSEQEWKLADRGEETEKLNVVWSRGPEQWELLAIESRHLVLDQPPAEGPKAYVVTYRRGMTADEVQGAFQFLLERQPSEDLLLPFVQQWHREKARMNEFFAAHPPRHVDTLRVLAQWEADAGNVDAARELLLRSYALNRLLHNGENRSKFDKLAEKLGIEKLPDQFDTELVVSLGLIDVRDGKAQTLTVHAGEEVVVWLASDGEEQTVLKLSVTRRRNGEWQLGHEVCQVQKHGNSRSWTSPQAIDPASQREIWISHFNEPVAIVPRATDDPNVIELQLQRKAK